MTHTLTLLDTVKFYETHVKHQQALDSHFQLETSQGVITFYGVSEDAFAIYLIDIKPELRGKGIFRSLIEYLVSSGRYRWIMILAVGSPILDKILLTSTFEGNKFICQGGDFILTC